MGTVGIIGAGSVGSSIASALVQSGIPQQVVLVDVRQERCRGEALDLADGAFLSDTTVRQGSWSEVAQSNVIVITAGVKQRPDESRDELVGRNCQIFQEICTNLLPIAPDAIVMIVSNPVDVLAAVFQRISKLPAERVIGSGTFLDSMRFREAIAKRLALAPSSIHAYILGEHGDQQIPVLSTVSVGGAPLSAFPNIDEDFLRETAIQTRDRAYEIIKLKGSTYHGIAACVRSLIASILGDRCRVCAVSVYSPAFQTYVSLPAVLGRQGIVRIVPIADTLSPSESSALKTVACSIRDRVDSICKACHCS
ncbi:L-lactate dehydrogenase [Plasmodiophora brassicae]